MDDSEKVQLLRDYLKMKDQNEGEAVNWVHVLGAQEQLEINNDHARRLGRVQDAFWKSRCPDYETEAEEEDGAMARVNMVNCTFQDEKQTKAMGDVLNKVFNDGEAPDILPEKPPPPPRKQEQPQVPAPPPPRKRANKLMNAALLGAGLAAGGGLTYVGLKAIDRPPAVDPSLYSIEAYNPE